MNGSLNRNLHGILAPGVLAAALLLASAGCVGAPAESGDDDEDVAAAAQELDAVDSDGAGDAADDDDEASGNEGAANGGVLPTGHDPNDAEADPGGPDPLPWNGLFLVPGDDPDASDPAPMAHTSSSTPSTGNGGK